MTMTEKQASASSYPVSIFIAGDYNIARKVCSKFCMTRGACVTVTPTTYIYTGGEETGVIVGFINYPCFPMEHIEILRRADELAENLMIELYQHSYTIQTPTTTYWKSRRKE